MHSPDPLPRPAEPALNRLQRWCFDWAQRYCLCLPIDQQEPARAIDRFQFSRRGLAAWLGAAGATAGCTPGLWAANMPPARALTIGLLLVFVLIVGIGADTGDARAGFSRGHGLVLRWKGACPSEVIGPAVSRVSAGSASRSR